VRHQGGNTQQQQHDGLDGQRCTNDPAQKSVAPREDSLIDGVFVFWLGFANTVYFFTKEKEEKNPLGKMIKRCDRAYLGYDNYFALDTERDLCEKFDTDPSSRIYGKNKREKHTF
jgi:hypothetical protein